MFVYIYIYIYIYIYTIYTKCMYIHTFRHIHGIYTYILHFRIALLYAFVISAVALCMIYANYKDLSKILKYHCVSFVI